MKRSSQVTDSARRPLNRQGFPGHSIHYTPRISWLLLGVASYVGRASSRRKSDQQPASLFDFWLAFPQPESLVAEFRTTQRTRLALPRWG